MYEASLEVKNVQHVKYIRIKSFLFLYSGTKFDKIISTTPVPKSAFFKKNSTG